MKLAGHVGVVADLLRTIGLLESNPSLLVESFERTHEFRSRTGIVGRVVEPGALEIRGRHTIGVVILEAELALACADKRYIGSLIREIGTAKVWCRIDEKKECEILGNWKGELVKALEYGLEAWKADNSKSHKFVGIRGELVAEVWRQADWLRIAGVEYFGGQDLCPNRPAGIGESKNPRSKSLVDQRTREYQEIRTSKPCKLSPRIVNSVPTFPRKANGLEEWRVGVKQWIQEERRKFRNDVEAVEKCQGKVWK